MHGRNLDHKVAEGEGAAGVDIAVDVIRGAAALAKLSKSPHLAIHQF